jgi:hypothetical protein
MTRAAGRPARLAHSAVMRCTFASRFAQLCCAPAGPQSRSEVYSRSAASRFSGALPRRKSTVSRATRLGPPHRLGSCLTVARKSLTMSCMLTLPSAGAIFSEDGRYRYKLWRRWDDNADAVMWIMLNPSTADSAADDPTIRRCIFFAKHWGFGGIEVYNLFAFRSTRPRGLEVVRDPVGPDNDSWLMAALRIHKTIIAAWGSCQTKRQWHRAASIMWLLMTVGTRPVVVLGLTKGGQPRHPLYLPKHTPLRPFPIARQSAGRETDTSVDRLNIGSPR